MPLKRQLLVPMRAGCSDPKRIIEVNGMDPWVDPTASSSALACVSSPWLAARSIQSRFDQSA